MQWYLFGICLAALFSGRAIAFKPSFQRIVKPPRIPVCRAQIPSSHVSLDLGLTDLSQQIYCNVELNGANLEAVGFDMDYTLAQVC
jgi:hypothetical protein